MTSKSDSPQGQSSPPVDTYAPDLLHAVDRADARKALALGDKLPFSGVDIWTAWELSWLDDGGRPVVATLSVAVPADSPRLVESKSFKLYLNSLAMTRYTSYKDVARIVATDLRHVTGGNVRLDLKPASKHSTGRIKKLPGRCVDYQDVACDRYELDSDLLQADGNAVSESLHSHVFRSRCPVTGQPDSASVLITYHGPRIEPGSLLRYLASFRQHCDFHEACVERIFCDLKKRCGAEQLTVYARFNRRGGIDINPFRSDFESDPAPIRLWRQ